MSAHDPADPRLAEWFGHDRVALFGAGGMPAAPPAPPGSTARRAGEVAVADGLAKAGTPGARPGSRPAVAPPRPAAKRALRMAAERASMEASQRAHTVKGRNIVTPDRSGWLWRSLFVPAYRSVPWPLKRRLMVLASGVRDWSGPSR